MKYNTSAHCPKCDNTNISTEYVGNKFGIRRVCGRCGYWWYEEPLDEIKKKQNDQNIISNVTKRGWNHV